VDSNLRNNGRWRRNWDLYWQAMNPLKYSNHNYEIPERHKQNMFIYFSPKVLHLTNEVIFLTICILTALHSAQSDMCLISLIQSW
jgi:hypothetical protein